MTHGFCWPCFAALYPLTIPGGEGLEVPCCKCGQLTSSGIRHNVARRGCERLHQAFDYEAVRASARLVEAGVQARQTALIRHGRLTDEGRARIRELFSLGLDRKEIATLLGLRYHRVRDALY